MKLSLTPLSDHSKPITSRDELDNYIVESFAGSSQVKFSALVEHRMYADKMIGWWDPVSKAGAIYGDHLAEASAASGPVEEKKKAGGIVKPLTTAGDDPANTVTTPLSEGHAYAFLNESTIGPGDAPSLSSIDWSIGKGDWTVAKAEGRRIFADYNKSSNTDAVLAVKTAAAAAQKKGSYLGAVLLGLANDYFESQR